MTDRLVRIALRGNAAFSALSGVASLAAAALWSDGLGVPAPVLVVLGLGLLPYAALLARFAGRPEVRAIEALVAVVADVGWVVGAAAILVGWPDAMSSAGRWALGLLTLVVADFAVTQWIGLRRLQTRS